MTGLARAKEWNSLKYGGPGLYRVRWDIGPIIPALEVQAIESGWDRKSALTFVDSDDYPLAGIVPK